ncbi:MAG TPA: UDP-glucose 4-epimerase GalE [Candidatus Bathyarchaeia archaeon]|nr:UDP-glucose 4-epimerase GalE [Candidatus Bathyarchaeia archaeon]
MKILVTGGAGYIGSHAVKLLLENHHQVFVIDNLYRGFRECIEVLQKKYGRENLAFAEIDLRNFTAINAILEKEKPAGVLHFAALCLVSESIEKPQDYFDNNLIGSLNLLKAVHCNGINNLVFSSTCAVYGESQYLPIDEMHPLNPTNAYGDSKLMVEKMIFWFGKVYGLRYAILRYFNVAGAASDGLIGDSKKPSELLVQNAVRGALGIETFRLTCPKVKTKDGTPIRDYINIEDLVEAHLDSLNYLEKGGKSETFNLGTGNGNSVLEVVDQVKKLTGKNFLVEKSRPRKGEYAHVYADIGKARKLLGWQPSRTLRDSVQSLIKWYKSHPHGWQY